MRRLVVLLLVTGTAGATAATSPREIVFGGGSNAVLAIRPDGTGLRVVAERAANPRWSPNVRQIVFTAFATDGGNLVANGLTIVSAHGEHPIRITAGEDRALGWSPNGRWIGFVRYAPRGGSGLYVVRPDGSGARRLALARGGEQWSPDSRGFLVGGLAVVDLAGRVRRLTFGRCAAGGSWSPDARWIAFATCPKPGLQPGIAVAHPDGTGVRSLVRPSRANGRNLSDPVWSPDSRKLAYVEGHQLGDQEHTEIRMVSLAGRPLGNLDSHGQNHDEYPAWSPDGKQIVFDRDAAVEPIGDSVRLCIGDVHTGRVRILAANTARGTQSWRPPAQLP